MKHLAAYLLLGLGGNTSPSAADVKAVLESVGIEADESRLNTLISELEGKDINEVCAYFANFAIYPILTCPAHCLRFREACFRSLRRCWWCCPLCWRRCRRWRFR